MAAYAVPHMVGVGNAVDQDRRHESGPSSVTVTVNRGLGRWISRPHRPSGAPPRRRTRSWRVPGPLQRVHCELVHPCRASSHGHLAHGVLTMPHSRVRWGVLHGMGGLHIHRGTLFIVTKWHRRHRRHLHRRGPVGRLDLLVNNAGVTAVMPMADTDASMINHMFAVNVTAPSLLAHAALPHPRDSSGSIVNVSSTYGHRPCPEERTTPPPRAPSSNSSEAKGPASARAPRPADPRGPRPGCAPDAPPGPGPERAARGGESRPDGARPVPGTGSRASTPCRSPCASTRTETPGRFEFRGEPGHRRNQEPGPPRVV
ncbi:SDR family NAD(P)-dependent oxidoreductase [Embleya sp. NPDC050493]|uniref:SDR family NAD(P)-dependent oxidoreductase n=1 Tax=Embleya sp. NPDC050493 TaxID=3363989 RepID=UPI0037911A6F